MRNQEWTGADPANVPLGQHLHVNARPSVSLTAEVICLRQSLVLLLYSVQCVWCVFMYVGHVCYCESFLFSGFTFYVQVQVFLEAVSYSLSVH